jgi:D-amino-acid oxidase
MNRRSFLQNSAAFAGTAALAGCVHRSTKSSPATAPPLAPYDTVAPIIPIRADLDRIFRITVCLRPFRAAGPRIEAEPLNDKIVVHNYGHGGSGWSLSWGSADVAVRKALAALNGSQQIAVIGCGAIGLTSAITAQRAGLKVTIYAKERPPFVRSSRATGSWTPDSRIALTSVAPTEFAAQWESMARASFAMYQSYLGSPGSPVEWTDRYLLSNPQSTSQPDTPQQHDFAYYNNRIHDLTPRFHDLPPASTPFAAASVSRNTSMTFNIADYSRQLLSDFLIAGGVIETREFHVPQDLTTLPQRVLINCTGYAARQLWSDDSLIPIRGQIAWLIPQQGINYGVYSGDLNVLARRDGIVVQTNPQGDDTGWNDSNEEPDRAAAEAGVRELQQLYRLPEKT